MDKPTLPELAEIYWEEPDSGEVVEGFTRATTIAHGESMAAWGAAQERKAMLDCRTCRQYTTASGGCLSVLHCVEGSAYQPTTHRRVWEVDRGNT